MLHRLFHGAGDSEVLRPGDAVRDQRGFQGDERLAITLGALHIIRDEEVRGRFFTKVEKSTFCFHGINFT